jgi:PAS domain-containing protein
MTPRDLAASRQNRGGDMLAQEIDFHEIFKLSPTAMALLTADLAFVDANDAFLEVARRPLEDLIGRNFFELFPKMPPDPGGDPRWIALERAMTSGRRECDRLIRYDVEDPARPGVFEERYWSAVVTPIRGADGALEVLELSAREITSVILQFRELELASARPA